MKKLILIFALIFSITESKAQFGLPDLIKKKAEEKVQQKTNDAIDDAVDGKKKDKKDKKDNKSDAKNEDNSSQSRDISTSNEIKTYSKFDYVPGDEIIFFENFAKDAIGDFPARWNTNGSGEVVNVSNSDDKWLQFKAGGFFLPDIPFDFPENFTVDFDFMLANSENAGYAETYFFICTGNFKKPDDGSSSPGGNGIKIRINVYDTDFDSYKDNSTVLDGSRQINLNLNTKYHLSMWVQKTRLRIYLNDKKVIDAPKAFPANIKPTMFKFINDVNQFPYITNLKIAKGAADTRNKLITDGKFVSHGILFNSASDKLKPESYGAIKDIAQVMKDNPTVNFLIIGHTDSDGNEDKNLDLSKKRAESVKTFLVNEFKIDATRLTTDGKGSSEPIASNDTQEGKASNRRVEFIKK